MLTAAFDMKAMLWRTSPASTELEDVVLDWLRQMLDLPEHFEGIIYDTASVSTMHAIAAARERAGFHVRDEGMSGRDDLPLYACLCQRTRSFFDRQRRYYTRIGIANLCERSSVTIDLR